MVGSEGEEEGLRGDDTKHVRYSYGAYASPFREGPL